MDYRPKSRRASPPTRKTWSTKEEIDHMVAEAEQSFVALLSLIMGFAVNTAFRSPHLVPVSTIVALSPAPTPSTFWGMFATAPNSSVAPLPTASTTTNMAVMPSTLKDFALPVFNPATTTPALQVASISVAPSPPAPCAPGVTGSLVEDRKPMAWTEKAKSTKDIIVRPPTALSIPPAAEAPATHTPSVSGSMAKVAALPVAESAPVTSLSLKIGDSLSEIADIAMKGLEEVVAHDFRELKNALDALMRAIGRQTTMILEESKSRAQVLCVPLSCRRRARMKRPAPACPPVPAPMGFFFFVGARTFVA
ncbi:hypothetical protein DFH07DRAFT_1022084 [Mycena maculata]|uniref:Uncharacterized protein n=1 Tax=Mycena maculata TaxID=230809 RepID=A0AAD7J9S2_9AGAR|nr:hypothetical protein DFH07DRAFT_1022084 [Mycena maculata]